MTAHSKARLESFVLATLRERRGWTQVQLAEAAELSEGTIKAYENGYRRLSRERLHPLAAIMGFSSDAVDCILFGLAGVPPLFEEAHLVAGLDDEEALRVRSAAARVGLVAAKEFEARAVTAIRRQRHEDARTQAGPLCRQLSRLSPSHIEDFLGSLPAALIYAVVERLSDESVKTATRDPRNAVWPASLALKVANHAPRDRDRNFLQGWAWAFVGNSLRAANGLLRAERAFSHSHEFLALASPFDDFPLDTWTLPCLEASLKRDQFRFEEALDLLRNAMSGAPPEAKANVLLERATTLETQGESEKAIETLEEVRPLIDGKRQHYLLFAQRFNLGASLINVDKATETERLLPTIRSLAVDLRSEISVVRVAWLTGIVAAAMERHRDALSSFEQVHHYFMRKDLVCDAANVALDEAKVRRRCGDYTGAKAKCDEAARVFGHQGIKAETVEALVTS